MVVHSADRLRLPIQPEEGTPVADLPIVGAVEAEDSAAVLGLVVVGDPATVG